MNGDALVSSAPDQAGAPTISGIIRTSRAGTSALGATPNPPHARRDRTQSNENDRALLPAWDIAFNFWSFPMSALFDATALVVPF
ncbi:MAG TPA: hypothetical protein VLJ19_21005, partial [Variovorax sp.]|nr:hypothetical protein [Variovorax sp.]